MMDDMPLPTWTRLDRHRSDWLEAYEAEITVFGETLCVAYVYLTEADGWCAHLCSQTSERNDSRGWATRDAAIAKAQISWAASIVGLPLEPAPAEARADAYRAFLLKLIGNGDVSGYQDLEIVELLLEQGDARGVDPKWVNMTHMQAHDQVRFALGAGLPVA